jgi:hypothetical protein
MYPSEGYQNAWKDHEAMVIPLVFARSMQKGCPWLRVRGNRLEGNGSIDGLMPLRFPRRAICEQEAMVIPLVFTRSVQKGCPWLWVRGNRLNQGCRGREMARLTAWCLFDFPREYFAEQNAEEILARSTNFWDGDP